LNPVPATAVVEDWGFAWFKLPPLPEPLTNFQFPPVIRLAANCRHALNATRSVQSDSLTSIPYAGSPSAEDDSCVVNRTSRFLFGRAIPSNFPQFRRLRQAACTFAVVRWTLTSAHGDEFQIPPNFASLALPRMSARSTSNLCSSGLHRQRQSSLSIEPSPSCAGRKCSFPIRYWATNCRDYELPQSVNASAKLD
jgi:hypothetical protein